MARAKRPESGSTIHTFTAVIEPDEEDGGYVVTFPAIPISRRRVRHSRRPV